MPTYAYRCADCGHAFDIYQQFSDEALSVCPECEGKLRKVFGSLGVTFSGSGFYRTDSRTDSTKPAANPTSTTGSSSTASSSTASSTAKSD